MAAVREGFRFPERLQAAERMESGAAVPDPPRADHVVDQFQSHKTPLDRTHEASVLLVGPRLGHCPGAERR